MANIAKVLYRGAASTTANTLLYTQPNTSTTTVVTDIVVTNTSAASATYTLSIADVPLASGITIGANDSTVISIKQVIAASNPAATIKGSASATTVIFHISGMEIS